ncbi:putative FAD-binding monooxygenase AlmA, partial [Pseudocercospora fuligena]
MNLRFEIATRAATVSVAHGTLWRNPQHSKLKALKAILHRPSGSRKGLRSDLDLYTFGFPWQPWTRTNPISGVPAIVDHMQESIENAAISRLANESPQVMTARFMILATGLYDYRNPLQADILVISSFRGQVVHPPFWPEGLDYAGKELAIIGSGATAITLLPSMVGSAKHGTMLQESIPTRTDSSRSFAAPTYTPFDRRMCLCSGGDFYPCLRDGKSSIKASSIERVEADRIKFKSGEATYPDVIVAATHLKLQLGEGIQIEVDGKSYLIQDHYLAKLGILVGSFRRQLDFGRGLIRTVGLSYFRADAERGGESGRYCAGEEFEEKDRTQDVKFLPLSSTYVPKALSVLPKLGDRRHLGLRSTYVGERFSVRFGATHSGLKTIRL